MSQTLTSPDDLYARLEESARRRGLTIEEMLGALPIDDRDSSVEDVDMRRRHNAIARISTTQAALTLPYGEMPDSTALIHKNRSR